MRHFFLYKLKIIVAFLGALTSVQMVCAQSINAPTNGGSTNICASVTGSEFTITSSFTGLPASTIFLLELSDTEGNFDLANPNYIGEPATILDNDIEFSIDFTLVIESFKGSDIYEMRVVTSDGFEGTARTFAIYNRTSVRLEVDSSCLLGGGTIVAEPSDLDSYIWFKEDSTGSLTIIPGASSNTIEVFDVGFYRWSPDLGNCLIILGNSGRSDITEVRASSGTEVAISGPPGSSSISYSTCSDEVVLLDSSVTDISYIYEWYKDDVELADITSETFTVSGSESPTLTVSGIDMEGIYRVAFTQGLTTNECADQSGDFSIILRNPKISITSETTVLLLPPGEPKTITADVIRGDNPVITWFKDGAEIANSDTENLEVTEAGLYTVRLEATSECPEDNTVFAIEEVQVIPAEDLNITIGYTDATYEDCEFSEVVLEVTEITAIVDGDTVVLDASALADLEVDWQRDGVSTGETGGTILLNSASDNGTYTASITLDTGTFTSENSLTVILSLDSFEILLSEPTLPLGGQIELSLGLDDTAGYTFQWFMNFEEIPNSNSETIEITEAGRYSVQVFFSACGEEDVPAITVTTGSAVIPNVVTPNGDGVNDDWVLTGDLTLNEEVEVNIYTSSGELDYSTVSYNGEWPDESRSKALGTVYYYVINRNNSSIEQGSITIIR